MHSCKQLFHDFFENVAKFVNECRLLTDTLLASGIQFPNAARLPGMKNSSSLGLKTPQNYQLVKEFETEKLNSVAVCFSKKMPTGQPKLTNFQEKLNTLRC